MAIEQEVAVRLQDKMDTLLRLVAAMATKGLSQRQQIEMLDRVGLAPKDIAAAVGTTSNTVRVALVHIRRAARTKRRRGRAIGIVGGEHVE